MQSAPLITSPVTIFFVVLAIIVLAPVIMNRLRIPHIVGMIIAGVVVGPHGFNLLADDSSFIIFGQVGLLYLMFLAGLEIDMYHLKLNFKKGIFFGALTFLVPIGLGVAVSYYVFHMSLLTSFLLGAMYAAHTLISYPVAARYGVTKSPAVLIAVVGTIFAVFGSLVVLACVGDIAANGIFDLVRFAWLIVKTAIYVALVMFLYPPLTRLFLKHYVDRVTQYVFILALVFLSSLLADQIGLSAVLGAFLAGLVLNRYVPPASPLMSRIEFVGNSIFVPYFLISVGMMVNLRLLANEKTLVIAGIMLVVALVSKWIAAQGARLYYGMSKSEGNVMFGLTTAHTAVALAVVTMGYTTILPSGEPMLDSTILNATILVILVTCAMAPIITAGASAKLRISILEREHDFDRDDETNQETRDFNVLIPVVNPITAPSLMELALLLEGRNARGRQKVSTFLLHVRNDNGKKSRSIGRNSIELAAKVASAVDVAVTPVQRFDINTTIGITNFINERDISMVVMGMHRKATVVDTFLGPKIEQLLERTRAMTVISRCYVPVNTLSQIKVYVPQNAHLEKGFRLWVQMLSHLANELGSTVVFYTPAEVEQPLESMLRALKSQMEWRCTVVNGHDDFVLLSRHITDDDLFVWITARQQTVSWTKEQSEMQTYVQNNLQLTNLIMVYPEISEENLRVASFATPFD